MTHLSRPLIGLLVATVAVFALWYVELRPGSTNGPNGKPGLGAYQGAINAARHAVTTANQASARSGGTVATTPATSATTKATATKATATKTRTAPAAKSATRTVGGTAVAATATHPVGVSGATAAVQALHQGKVLALLFYNPAAADDQAVKQELAAVGAHGGRVLSQAVPLTQISSYSTITNHVPVNFTPTLVVVAGDGQAYEITGFADGLEISQRVDDALAAPR